MSDAEAVDKQGKDEVIDPSIERWNGASDDTLAVASNAAMAAASHAEQLEQCRYQADLAVMAQEQAERLKQQIENAALIADQVARAAQIASVRDYQLESAALVQERMRMAKEQSSFSAMESFRRSNEEKLRQIKEAATFSYEPFMGDRTPHFHERLNDLIPLLKAERSPSSRYRRLTPQQTILLLVMVDKANECEVDECEWLNETQMPRVQSQEIFIWPAPEADLKVLASLGYLDFTIIDDANATIKLKEPAYLAKRHNCELCEYDLILASACACTFGKLDNPVDENLIAVGARTDLNNARRYLKQMVRDGELKRTEEATGKSKTYTLTRLGIAVVNHAFVPPTTQEPPMPSMNFHNSPVGNLNLGQQGDANVKQQVTNNVNINEWAKLLDDAKTHLSALAPEDRREAEEAVDDLKQEIASQKPSTGKIKAFCMRALAAAGGLAAFSDSIHKVCQNFGINIERMKNFFGR